MTEQEYEELGDLATKVRRVWRARSPENRREYERRIDEAAGVTFSEVQWRLKYEELAERFDRALDHEIRLAREALSRVSRLAWDAQRGGRKTIKAEDLAEALRDPEPSSAPA